MMQTLIPITLATFLVAGCSSDLNHIADRKQNIYTDDSSKSAFKHSYKFDSYDEEDIHMLGKSFFTKPWVEAPAATSARDGLGPLFSANTCIHCHPNNSAGVPLDKNEKIQRSLVMRLSIPNIKNINNALVMSNGFTPEPKYGGQFSLNATSDTPYEGSIKLEYSEIVGKYADSESYRLQNPIYTLADFQYGPLHKETNIAPHIGLALIGLGAIEMIKEEDILAHEDVNDSDGDGISGKANWVYNPETNATELGRFTWKAASATVKQQVANAAHNDMGLSNPLYRGDNCTEFQKECQEAQKGKDELDLPMKRLDAIAFYLKTLRIPKQRKTAEFTQGEAVFNSLGCAKCHISEYSLRDGNTIKPYSDFLLHDMGDALSDGHTMFKATANEFRTPPLWGIGLYEKVSGQTALLHDGRARSIEEAILWHGGEALDQQLAFKALDKENRDYLVEFLKGI